MSRKLYQNSAHLGDRPAPDWRWRRAGWIASGDPAAERYGDDAVTLLAVKVQSGEEGPELDDVRAAWSVYQTGGLPKRVLEAYLLTDLSPTEVGERMGLTEAVVCTYADLFLSVRGEGPVTAWVRAEAEASPDPLVRAARFGPQAVQVREAMEVGEVRPEWTLVVEMFELAEAMDRLAATDPMAYIRAADRRRRIERR